jgi:hypothetical protein
VDELGMLHRGYPAASYFHCFGDRPTRPTRDHSARDRLILGARPPAACSCRLPIHPLIGVDMGDSLAPHSLRRKKDILALPCSCRRHSVEGKRYLYKRPQIVAWVYRNQATFALCFSGIRIQVQLPNYESSARRCVPRCLCRPGIGPGRSLRTMYVVGLACFCTSPVLKPSDPGGGKGYTGPTSCATGNICVYSNEYYSQVSYPSDGSTIVMLELPYPSVCLAQQRRY